MQRYQLPKHVSPKTYIETLGQMRCGTVVTIGPTLRDAAATDAKHVSRFVVIADRPVSVPDAVSLTPAEVTEAAIETAVTTASK